jgi:DNA-binding transcriptional LysR family regulator
MHLQHLRTLVAIAEQGSLSAAARALRISQPAVTKQIQRMESEIGLTLLVRGPRRPAALTPAGERMLIFARDTLAHLEALERELAALKEIGQGTLSLAASTIPGEYLLPGVLAAFRTRYPRLKVEMSISDTADVATKVLADEVDVGVLGSSVRRAGLRLERLVEDEIVLAVPSDHAFAGRDRVSVEELKDQPLILREEGSGTRRSVEELLAAAGLALPRDHMALILGSTQSIVQGVEQGLGLGFVSARASSQAQADGYLACVRLAGVDLRRDLYLAYLPGRAADPLVARFLDFCRSHLNSETAPEIRPDLRADTRPDQPDAELS